uniref:Nuclear pore complex protein Nup153 n=1 Tax=Salarias fasciatus TaxID=181472 RepID=A0A672J0M4_SALFA
MLKPKESGLEKTKCLTLQVMFGLGDKFKKPEGAWDCDVCLVQNKAADVQCVVCEAAKPGASMEPKGNKHFCTSVWSGRQV